MIDIDVEGANAFPMGKRCEHTAVGVVVCSGAALQLVEAVTTHVG
jgi:hypothetical protein